MEFLLGITKDNNIIFGDFHFYDNNEFVGSFEGVEPFQNEESNGIEYFEELLSDCYDDASKNELCERYDCTPSQLAETMAEIDGINTIADERDCSYYEHRFDVDGIEYAFESISGGQYDFMKDGIKELTNVEVVTYLYNMWKQYHLKQVTDEERAKIEEAMKKLPEKYSNEAENIIKEYIRKYVA